VGIWPVAHLTTWGICFATFADAHKLSGDHAEAGALGPGARGAGHVEVGVVDGGEGEGEGEAAVGHTGQFVGDAVDGGEDGAEFDDVADVINSGIAGDVVEVFLADDALGVLVLDDVAKVFAQVEGPLRLLPGFEIREEGVEPRVIGKDGKPGEDHAVADEADIFEAGAELLDLDAGAGIALEGKALVVRAELVSEGVVDRAGRIDVEVPVSDGAVRGLFDGRGFCVVGVKQRAIMRTSAPSIR